MSDESERYHDKQTGLLIYHVAGLEADARISQIPAHRVRAAFVDESAFEVNIPARALLEWAATQAPDTALSVLRDLLNVRPFRVEDEFHVQARQLEAICRRAHALVAEHATNEETP